jgi:hypothetical protein
MKGGRLAEQLLAIATAVELLRSNELLLPVERLNELLRSVERLRSHELLDVWHSELLHHNALPRDEHPLTLHHDLLANNDTMPSRGSDSQGEGENEASEILHLISPMLFVGL